MTEPAYRRVLLKISGESFSGPDDGGIDADSLGVQLSTLRYALDAAAGLISDNRPFRDKVISIVSKNLAAIVSVSATGSALHSAAAVALCVAYQLLNKAEEVGKLLTTLCSALCSKCHSQLRARGQGASGHAQTTGSCGVSLGGIRGTRPSAATIADGAVCADREGAHRPHEAA